MNNLEKTKKLPTIAELMDEQKLLKFDKNDQFNRLVMSNPSPKFIKKNPFANNSDYLPIGIVETMMLKLFGSYQVEVLREGVAFNSVYVVVRVHYSHPINGATFQDGIGSAQVQVKKGSSPAQMENINNNAVMMAFPVAKSLAFKDACDHIGRIFGRDLNRKDVLDFTENQGVRESVDIIKNRENVRKYISDCTSIDDLSFLENDAIYYGVKLEFDTRMNELKGI
mgnify:CR=1 FL=1